MNIFHLAIEAGQLLAIVAVVGNGLLQTAQFGIAIKDIIQRRAVGVSHLLGHMGNPPLGGYVAAPGIAGQPPHQHLKECGFAAAIGTDQARFLAGKNCKIGRFQQEFATALQADALELNHGKWVLIRKKPLFYRIATQKLAPLPIASRASRNPQSEMSMADLWTFAQRIYACPQVEAACLYGQDQHQVRVNILLWLIWLGHRQQRLELPQLQQATAAIDHWHQQVTLPLRALRRLLKPQVEDDPAAGPVREQIKVAELAAEQYELQKLEVLTGQLPWTADPMALEKNLQCYARACGLPAVVVDRLLLACEEALAEGVPGEGSPPEKKPGEEAPRNNPSREVAPGRDEAK